MTKFKYYQIDFFNKAQERFGRSIISKTEALELASEMGRKTATWFVNPKFRVARNQFQIPAFDGPQMVAQVVPIKPEIKVGIIKLPSISNFSDFDPLENEESIEIEWVIKSQSLNQFDFVILPGSKQTIKDQLFLDESGISDNIREYSNKGNIIGICGGLQMLGTIHEDPFLNLLY